MKDNFKFKHLFYFYILKFLTIKCKLYLILNINCIFNSITANILFIIHFKRYYKVLKQK